MNQRQMNQRQLNQMNQLATCYSQPGVLSGPAPLNQSISDNNSIQRFDSQPISSAYQNTPSSSSIYSNTTQMHGNQSTVDCPPNGLHSSNFLHSKAHNVQIHNIPQVPIAQLDTGRYHTSISRSNRINSQPTTTDSINWPVVSNLSQPFIQQQQQTRFTAGREIIEQLSRLQNETAALISPIDQHHTSSIVFQSPTNLNGVQQQQLVDQSSLLGNCQLWLNSLNQSLTDVPIGQLNSTIDQRDLTDSRNQTSSYASNPESIDSVILHHKSNLIKPKTDRRCSNCEINHTTMWRKIGPLHVCNACGLYFRVHGVNRPYKMHEKQVHKRRRLHVPKASLNVPISSNVSASGDVTSTMTQSTSSPNDRMTDRSGETFAVTVQFPMPVINAEQKTHGVESNVGCQMPFSTLFVNRQVNNVNLPNQCTEQYDSLNRMSN